MKRRSLTFIFSLLIVLACNDDDVYREIEEVPGDIFHVELCPNLVDNVNKLFPESQNNKEKYPDAFDGGSAQQRIVLTQESEVYVSYVAEGATIGSVLGYYVYEGSAPGSPDDIRKEIVFPNVDKSVLVPGDTRRLGSGKFKAGTVIGFFLIVGGYRDGGVYLKKPTLYTDSKWNANNSKQHILFRENECSDIIVGFEDKLINDGDADFNDILFKVTDNREGKATTSFEIQTVPGL